MRMNKKAVSLMLSYVILIVIAISLAIGVYSWLRLYANVEEIDKCPKDTALIIQDYECSGGYEINITVKNKGLFNVSGFYIRGAKNISELAAFPLKYSEEVYDADGKYEFNNPLQPNEIHNQVFSYIDSHELKINGVKKIEIEPFRVQEDKKVQGKTKEVLCDGATINIEVDC